MRDTSLGVHREALEAAAGVGSGNFNFVVPVASYPGRGEQPLALDLIYNSRVWQRAGSLSTSPMIFDIDHDWPAPGWLLGFGKMISIGDRKCMLVARDGTRHPYVEQSRVEHLSGFFTVIARTRDGSFIEYSHEESAEPNYFLSGRAKYPDGSVVEFRAPSVDHDELYPTRIIDRNGNYLSVAYRAGIGPEIETVTDTCGRVIRFHYDPEDRLTALTGPGAAAKDIELVKLHYSVRDLEYSFARSIPVVPPGPATMLDAIFFPGTATGYSFLESGDYSSYGMLRRVRECRGMSSSSTSLDDQGTIHGGAPSRLREYDYPDAPGKELDDSPTYSTMAETWAGQVYSRPALTKYKVTRLDSTVQTEIGHSDGSRTVQSLKPAPDAPQGVFSQLLVEDRDGNKLQQTDTNWESGSDASPRITSVGVTDQRNRTALTTFAYGAAPNQVTDVRQYDYNGTRVLRRTHTDYVSSPEYTSRHILSLPSQVQVFDRDGVAASRVQYEYDGYDLGPTPGVVGLHERFDPANRRWVPPHREKEYDPEHKPPVYWVDYPGYWEGAYDATTRYRGNPTLVRRFTDAANQSGPVTDTRAYDLCGNLVTTDLAGRRTEYQYRHETQYSQPSAIVTGSPGPASSARIQTATTYNSAGLPRVVTDANGQKLEIQYDEKSLRPSRVLSWTKWSSAEFEYDDSAMTQTRTVYAATTPSTITSKEVTGYDGKGHLASHKREAVGGVWDVVEYRSDQLGRNRWQSAPHRDGHAPSWGTSEYDPLDRLVRTTAPDSSTTSRHYDEQERPGIAVPEEGPTVRMIDAWGRERWAQFDALGRLEQVVEPIPAGTVLPGGSSVTLYLYDGNDNVIMILSNPWLRRFLPPKPSQERIFRYDGLGRLTAAYMPERGRGLDDAGSTTGVHKQWSEVFTYDERSNMISRKDSRGITTRYDYGGDPLDRVQRISYDMSEFADTDNPVLPCPDVLYTYEPTGDLRRVRTETAHGVCTQRYTYDAFAGLTSTKLTMDRLPDFPFEVGYDHDTLGRVTTTTYPTLYGEPSATRPEVRYEYDIGDTPMRIEVDGVDAASTFSFNAAGHITSMLTGPAGAQQVTETYAYDDWHQWLQVQKLAKDGTLLLDLEYDYHAPPSSASGKTGQVTQCRDHLDENHTRTYTYDGLARLKMATGGPPDGTPLWNETYTYDDFGNRTGVEANGSWWPGGQIPIPRDGAANTVFDQNTNRVVSTDYVRYDAAGNQVVYQGAGGVGGYNQYDAAGRLAVVSDRLGTPITTHIYGACNRRRASQRGDNGWLTYYAWSGDVVVAEYTDRQPDVGDKLLWQSNSFFLGSRLLARRYAGDRGYADSRLEYEHPDRTGTRFVTRPQSDRDDSDEVMLPYGTSLVPGGGASHAFTSYDRDPRTRLDYAVNRFYDTGLGRFLQPDPIGPAAYRKMDPQSLNLYAYVGNDPVNHTDPLGLADEIDPLYCEKHPDLCSEEVVVYGWVPDDSPMPDVVLPGGGGVGGGGKGEHKKPVATSKVLPCPPAGKFESSWGVEFDLSVVLPILSGGGGIVGLNLQWTPDDGLVLWSVRPTAKPSNGFSLGAGLQVVFGRGEGSWKGAFQSTGIGILVAGASEFHSPYDPSTLGWSGISGGVSAGAPFSFYETETEYASIGTILPGRCSTR